MEYSLLAGSVSGLDDRNVRIIGPDENVYQLTISSTTLHSTTHELLRMSTLPIIIPSPTSGFHSAYYLGLGWGLAEVTWGIVQGWEQMSLYEDVMTPELDSGLEETKTQGLGLIDGDQQTGEDEDGESGYTIQGMDEVSRQLEEEAELERKVEALERMRGRRGMSTDHQSDLGKELTSLDLEEVIGVPFPVCRHIPSLIKR